MKRVKGCAQSDGTAAAAAAAGGGGGDDEDMKDEVISRAWQTTAPCC